MATITRPASSRPKGGKPKATQRLDIQGLRMVAVMLVVFSHLFNWPRGGFIGVDVFFVISGFLITGSLLHTFEKTGRISFSSFYRRRIRRIVPAATLVLVATCIAAYFTYTGSRFKSTALDAIAAFFFVSNWRFGIEGTDYFSSSGPVSPLQHYWSLSVEEQFYFVWPAVISITGIVVARMAWQGRARIVLSASVMGVVVVASFAYSFLDTANNPTWAYFSTLTRVWELGVGAILAIMISSFERIPNVARPFIAWTGLIVIAVGAFVITETGGGFPGPWAAVPVFGAALVIIAGVAGEQKYLQPLTNRGSTYVGDISYSLYLWHWPVIILLSSLMDRNVYYFTAALCLMFGFSTAAYHFFENPIRASKWLENSAERRDRSILDRSRWRLSALKLSETNQSIGIGALALATAGLVAFALNPHTSSALPTVGAAPAARDLGSAEKPVGPAQQQLTEQIAAATKATAWPELNPSMDDAIAGKQVPAYISPCGQVERPSAASCTWGDPQAPHTIMVLGDSVAMTYLEPLKNFAEGSAGQWKVRSESMFGCTFTDLDIKGSIQKFADACPKRKADAVSAINTARPDVVVLANSYGYTDASGWSQGMSRYIQKFAANTGRVVLLAAPPADVNIGDCYTQVSKPTDCVSTVTSTWSAIAEAERQLANSINGAFVDSQPWFCTREGYCPSFVGSTPAKIDRVHMTPEYADVISPAFAEALNRPGVLAE